MTMFSVNCGGIFIGLVKIQNVHVSTKHKLFDKLFKITVISLTPSSCVKGGRFRDSQKKLKVPLCIINVQLLSEPYWWLASEFQSSYTVPYVIVRLSIIVHVCKINDQSINLLVYYGELSLTISTCLCHGTCQRYRVNRWCSSIMRLADVR